MVLPSIRLSHLCDGRHPFRPTFPRLLILLFLLILLLLVLSNQLLVGVVMMAL